MKKRYINLMEKALSAYSNEHILRYYDSVKRNGLTEHGFPRLVSNIGILIAKGRQKHLLPLFTLMMDFCCNAFLCYDIKAANEFSVREIVCALNEIEKANVVDKTHVANWKQKISQIIPESCYNIIVKSEDDWANNVAIFGAVSELARIRFNLGNNFEFIDRQLSSQFQWLDENEMYCDHRVENAHQPMMYDIVPRALFSLLIYFGYRGKYYEKIDDCLKKTGLLTLKMQSCNGEVAFGGRSNQFIHNEPLMIAIFEYEAQRYFKEGNLELARAFKRAISRAVKVTEYWLNKKPISHVKNRFPIQTEYGVENYAYFDKYMITVASNLYIAYLLCDDNILADKALDHKPVVFETSKRFHKLFLKSGGYSLEFDTNGDVHYDASGLGRVHCEGAPSTICMSCPCPSKPSYKIDIENPFALSLCSAVNVNGEWKFGAEEHANYEVLSAVTQKDSALATILCKINNKVIKENYLVNKNGVSITIDSDDEIGYVLPAFYYNGAEFTKINANKHTLTISYEGFVCRYTTNGEITDLNKVGANRNGHYKAFIAKGENSINVKIEIIKE